ncbi:ABC transporter permease [Pseudogemmobacter bohemicus]|uniref:ABC transporter permease n=1 Tax=Pseudogemmobacter bohemicus TaxID=2250708 RepID=UPI000DD2C8B0|nr:ABC transporter permease [Pseudogemmobacter bohemicus]
MGARISRATLLRWAPFLVLIALVVFFTILNPSFFSLRNAARIALAATPALMVAIGVTFILIMGSIDLSMEGAVSVTAVLFATVFLQLGGTLASWAWIALPAAVLAGAVFGMLNGWLHVKLQIPSFMASLAFGFVGTGLALMMTGGDRIRVEDELFRGLLTFRFAGFPLMVWLAFGFVLIAWFIQTRTTIGRNLYAVGGGEELAHASGLNTRRVRVIGFTLAGAFYALGALMAVARIGIAETATGNNFMFISITSAVVGGVALWGGIGGVWNAVVGVLIVNVINNGMVVIGLPDYLQDGVLGLMVILAVVLSTDRRLVSFVK